MSTATAAKNKAASSGLGLADIGDVAGLLQAPASAAAGGPIDLALDFIDEDPRQPRTADNPGFSAQSLGELSATIRQRGVKTPISVRNHPTAPGRYIINHGARRYRASRLAGKSSIPSFIDNDYLEADQVIENLQRNELTPREIADFIGRELARGKKKGDVAKELGKSPAFVSQHVTLLDLPEPIAVAFNSGRCRDVTVINELVTAHRKMSAAVEGWLADENQELTRGAVKLLREFLEEKGQHEEQVPEDDPSEGGGDSAAVGEEAEALPVAAAKEPYASKLKKAIVQVRHDERLARLLLTRRPPAEGLAWLKYEDDGRETQVTLAEVQLIAVLEG